eukprot:CAMPEP_0202891462 /NCGR_PEP_ID=MMETSP1392-20130828/1509_1 /ASSEMBLY_ACC=CAM_ASM_000868 /TAXON_ID=225041 /ORGANISM="Chlamydomonas chlamydogama, Strain SAG 11-48b" /LENGTH=154 /DNA_ID=CAMNT_0049575211 /DNA_START=957 /DNA_END=1422 /DNA_ORIENTATION=-
MTTSPARALQPGAHTRRNRHPSSLRPIPAAPPSSRVAPLLKAPIGPAVVMPSNTGRCRSLQQHRACLTCGLSGRCSIVAAINSANLRGQGLLPVMRYSCVGRAAWRGDAQVPEGSHERRIYHLCDEAMAKAFNIIISIQREYETCCVIQKGIVH